MQNSVIILYGFFLRWWSQERAGYGCIQISPLLDRGPIKITSRVEADLACESLWLQ